MIHPSAVGTLMHCPGSMKAKASLPKEPRNQYAQDGVVAHSLAAMNLGKECEIDVTTVDDEMLDAARVYSGYVLGFAKATGNVRVEKRVNVPMVHEKCYGTPDASWLDPRTDTLHVWDFKYGWGLVEVWMCWQLIVYALGLVDTTVKTISLHIIQPRPWHPDGPCRSWTFPAEQLYSLAPQIAEVAKEAMGENPRVCAGQWCNNCRAMLVCNTAWVRQSWQLQVTDSLQLNAVTPDSIGKQYAILRQTLTSLEKRLMKTEEMGLKMLKEGGRLPGISQTRTRGSTSWDVERDSMLATGDMLGVDLRKPPGIVTPNQAIKAGVPADIVSSLSTKYPGKLKLKIDDDRKASQIFKR